MVETLKRKSVKVGFFLGMGHFQRKFQTEECVTHQPLLVSENCSDCTFHVVSKYPQCIVWFCQKARVCQTERWTDGENYDSQDRASIAASRSKNGAPTY